MLFSGCIPDLIKERLYPGERWAGDPPNPLVRLRGRWGRHIRGVYSSIWDKNLVEFMSKKWTKILFFTRLPKTESLFEIRNDFDVWASFWLNVD